MALGGVFAVVEDLSLGVVYPRNTDGSRFEPNNKFYYAGQIVGHVLTTVRGIGGTIGGTGVQVALVSAAPESAGISLAGEGVANGIRVYSSGVATKGSIGVGLSLAKLSRNSSNSDRSSRNTNSSSNSNQSSNNNDVSKTRIEHAYKDHTVNKLIEQYGKRPENSLKTTLKNKSFFNPNWSKETIEKATIHAYKEALEKNITKGEYTTVYQGEKVTIYMESNANLRTSYGS